MRLLQLKFNFTGVIYLETINQITHYQPTSVSDKQIRLGIKYVFF